MFKRYTLAEAVSFLTIPIISRIYSPKEIGVYLFFTAASEILSTVSTGKFEMAIMLPRKKAQLLKSHMQRFMFPCCFVVLSSCLPFLFKGQASSFFNINSKYSSSFLLLGFYCLLKIVIKPLKIGTTTINDLKVWKCKAYPKHRWTGLQIILGSLGVFGLLWGRVLGFLFH